MNIADIFFFAILIILAATAATAFFKREWLQKSASRIFLYSAGLVFAYLIYLSFLQFRTFQEGPLASVLGSKNGLLWFLNYIRLHLWNDYLISLPFSLLFVAVANYFNTKYSERFFEKKESYLAALGILLVGYPGFLFYIPAVLILSSLVSFLFVRSGDRLPLYHFWIVLAIAFVVIIKFWAAGQPWWKGFIF